MYWKWIAALIIAASFMLPAASPAQDSTQPFMVRSYPEPARSMAAAEAAARQEALDKVLQRLAAGTWRDTCRQKVIAQAESFIAVIGKRYTEPNSNGLYEPMIGLKAMPAKAQKINETCNKNQVTGLGRPQLAVALTLCYKRDDGPCRKTADTPAWEAALNRAVERVLRDNGFDLPQLPPKFMERLNVARDANDIWSFVEGKVQFALVGRAVVDEALVRDRAAATGKAIPVVLNAKFLNLNASSGGAVAVQGEETGTGDTLKAAIRDAMPALAGDTVRTVAVNEVIRAWQAQADSGVPVDVAFQLFDNKSIKNDIQADLGRIAEQRGCTWDNPARVSCWSIQGEGALTDPVGYLEQASNGAAVCRISRNRRRFYVFTDKPENVCTGAGQYTSVAADYGDVVMRYCGPKRASWASGADRALSNFPDLGDCGGSYDLDEGARCYKVAGLDDGNDPLKVVNRALRIGRDYGLYEVDLTAAFAPSSRENRMRMVVGQADSCFE